MIEKETEIGVSAWREMGRAYGYWDFFLEMNKTEIKSQIREKIERLKKAETWNLQTATDLRFVFEAFCYNRAVKDVLKIIKEL